MSPIISVVIPCYNSGKYIRETIESVLKSENISLEIIIVDDGSKDELTQEVLSELQREDITVLYQTNQGPAAARNKGIEIAKGEYILPLDSDDKIRPRYLRLAVDLLKKDKTIGVVYGDAVFFDAKIGKWDLPDFEFEKLLIYNHVYACAVYRKSIWDDCGGYDENRLIWGWEDWDFWLSVAGKDWRFYRLNEVVFEYRIRDNSISSGFRENALVPPAVENYIVGKHSHLYKKKYEELYNDALWYKHWQKHPLRGATKLLLTKFRSTFSNS